MWTVTGRETQGLGGFLEALMLVTGHPSPAGTHDLPQFLLCPLFPSCPLWPVRDTLTPEGCMA